MVAYWQSVTPRMIWVHNYHINTDMRQTFFPKSSAKSGAASYWCMKIFNLCVGVDIFVKIEDCEGNWSYIHIKEGWNITWEKECKCDDTAVVHWAVTLVFPVSLSAKAWVLSRVNLCGICGRKIALGWVFSKYFNLSVLYHYISALSSLQWIQYGCLPTVLMDQGL